LDRGQQLVSGHVDHLQSGYVFGDLISEALDKSSPQLSLRAANGKPIPRTVIEFIQNSERRVRFYQLVLSDSYVSSVHIDGDPARHIKPVETVGLTFQRISWTYTEIDGRELSGSWDLARNTVGTSFRVTGTRQGSNILVSWPADAGKTYDILGSAIVTGPYSSLRTSTAAVTGTMSESFPLTGGSFFFTVRTQ
jgi:type VI protein secretion system component Hcp